MTSEGELYKKIKEDAIVAPFGDWTIEEDLLKIVLDEAKKDFPDILEVFEKYPEHRHETEIVNWFKKWFGEP